MRENAAALRAVRTCRKSSAFCEQAAIIALRKTVVGASFELRGVTCAGADWANETVASRTLKQHQVHSRKSCKASSQSFATAKMVARFCVNVDRGITSVHPAARACAASSV